MTTAIRTRHTKSEIWRYFEYINADSAKCKVCGKFYSRKGRTTTPLKNHLKSAHFKQYIEFTTADEVRRPAIFRIFTIYLIKLTQCLHMPL